MFCAVDHRAISFLCFITFNLVLFPTSINKRTADSCRLKTEYNPCMATAAFTFHPNWGNAVWISSLLLKPTLIKSPILIIFEKRHTILILSMLNFSPFPNVFRGKSPAVFSFLEITQSVQFIT